MVPSSLTYYKPKSRPFYGDGISTEISRQRACRTKGLLGSPVNACQSRWRSSGIWQLGQAGNSQMPLLMLRNRVTCPTALLHLLAEPGAWCPGRLSGRCGQSSNFCWEHRELFSSLYFLVFIVFFGHSHAEHVKFLRGGILSYFHPQIFSGTTPRIPCSEGGCWVKPKSLERRMASTSTEPFFKANLIFPKGLPQVTFLWLSTLSRGYFIISHDFPVYNRKVNISTYVVKKCSFRNQISWQDSFLCINVAIVCEQMKFFSIVFESVSFWSTRAAIVTSHFP